MYRVYAGCTHTHIISRTYSHTALAWSLDGVAWAAAKLSIGHVLDDVEVYPTHEGYVCVCVCVCLKCIECTSYYLLLYGYT
jgi:hypothetical protein